MDHATIPFAILSLPFLRFLVDFLLQVWVFSTVVVVCGANGDYPAFQLQYICSPRPKISIVHIVRVLGCERISRVLPNVGHGSVGCNPGGTVIVKPKFISLELCRRVVTVHRY